MKVIFTDKTSGVCEDVVYYSDGNKGQINFSFVWDEVSRSFPKITDGELKDGAGLIARFSRLSGAGTWQMFDRAYYKEVSKILSDTLSVLKMNITNEAA